MPTNKVKNDKFRLPTLPPSPSCPDLHCVFRCQFMMSEVSLMMGDKMELSRSIASRSPVSTKLNIPQKLSQRYSTKRLKTAGADLGVRAEICE